MRSAEQNTNAGLLLNTAEHHGRTVAEHAEHAEDANTAEHAFSGD